MNVERAAELFREKLRRNHSAGPAREHLEAAIAWLYAAQDSSSDRGVSHSYLVGHGWMRSYPETTGYIVPTLLNWSVAASELDSAQRALEMAEWELGVQLPSGAIPDLRDGRGVVFDTGQVIFGWLAAYRHSGDERFLDAANRGADWLVRARDEDGVWRFANDAGGPGRAYNARVVWSLLELASITGDGSLESASRTFLDWTLDKERGDGWFDCNCLTDDRSPLLHTIAYTARGQLESAMHLGERRYIEASRRTATAVASRVREDGYLPGRFDARWESAARWSCLTGMAQMCIVWRRLAAELDNEGTEARFEAEKFRQAAERVGGFLMRTQDRRSSNLGLRGGIRGSHPISGSYGQWRVLNWATKFFVDAMMIQIDPRALKYAG